MGVVFVLALLRDFVLCGQLALVALNSVYPEGQEDHCHLLGSATVWPQDQGSGCPLCRALLRSSLKFWDWFWGFYVKKDMEELECVWRRGWSPRSG